jgi:RES domain-containing protein
VALAALEMTVHLGRRSALGAYMLIGCSFDEKAVSRLDHKRVPKHRRSYPAPPELQAMGDEWVRSGSSAAIRVPSAVVPAEANYLLNPRHPDFARVRVHRPRPFDIDLRLQG